MLDRMRSLRFCSPMPILAILMCSACSVSDEEVGELVTCGKTAYMEAKYDSARTYFEKACSARPDNQEIHYFLGYTLEKLALPDGSFMPNVDVDLIEKSSKHFKRVIELSPKYEGEQLALDPYSKITAIWGSVALSHLSKGDVEAARQAFLKGRSEGGFYPAILEYNKNTMRSCEPDGILFTNGDNDTFPVYYLQVVDSFRTDITVVNLSLLNTEWYIRFLTKSKICRNIDVELSDAQLSRLTPIAWSQPRKVKIDVPATENRNAATLEVEVAPTLQSRYIRVQDILLLNIISTNKWIRDVYFSTTVANANFLGFKKYCAMEGLVMHLSYPLDQEYTMKKLDENLRVNYTYESVSDPHLQYIPDLHHIFNNYRIAFFVLLSDYKKHAQTNEIKNTLQFMNEKLPVAIVPYSNETLQAWMEELSKGL